MARRFPRSYSRFPIELLSADEAGKFGEAGSVMDISRGGLRVQTGPLLIPGRILHVFLEGQANAFARCRVVWARTHGDALPSEAGLEILEQLPGHHAARLNIPAAPSWLMGAS